MPELDVALVNPITNFPAFSGAVERTLWDRAYDHGVCAKDCGAIFDGTSHPLSGTYASLAAAQIQFPRATSLTQELDECAVQRAIDIAWENKIAKVLLPFGKCMTTGPIYQDHPDNLSVDTANPTHFAFSLAVWGMGGIGHENFGTIIKPASNDYVVWWLGPGQGNSLHYVNILPDQVNLSRANLPTTGIGIAIAGGPGGSSRTLIEGCFVEHLHIGISVGHNSDGLGDSNRFIGCNIENCYYGIKFEQSQNYINNLYGCNIGNCKYAVWSALGKAVNIFGGNLSAVSLLKNKFTAGSTSALIVTAWNNIQFDTTLTAPDPYMGFGDYDAFCFKTANFGLIPLLKTAYNSGTGVARFKIDPNHIDAEFGFGNDISTLTEIQADIQACTTVYCAERAFAMLGTGIHAYGIHLENPVSLTTLILSGSGFAGDTSCTIHDLYCNYSPGGQQWKTDPTLDCLYYLQQCFPFIESEDVPIVFRGGNFSDPTDGFLIRAEANALIRFEAEMGGLGSPKSQVYGNFPNLYDSNVLQTRGRGVGKYHTNPWFSSANSGGGSSGTNRNWKTKSLGQEEYWGFNPKPGSHPVITPAMAVALGTTPPGTIGQYPAITGGIDYKVWDPINNVDGTGKSYARSDHLGVSYGQNLTINWTYKGGSNCIYMSDVSLMQEGLVISPDNAEWYVVTKVMREGLNYVTVCRWANDGNPYLVGNKATVFTGPTIYQKPFVITRH